MFLYGLNLQAQIRDTLNQEVSPIGGINNLAIQYYGIEFTKAQRATLKEIEIEFIFQVDTNGTPQLAEVNGITDQAILDSLINKTAKINHFNPRIKNGIPQPSIYFMQLVFPTYKMDRSTFGRLQAQAYNEAKLEDFEYIHKSSQGFDMLFGGVVNQFVGNPAEHLGVGGGMKVNFLFSNKKQWFYGLNMSFYGNKLKKDYPINTTRPQFPSPPTLLLGASVGKSFAKINIQADLNLAVQNLTERIGTNDSDWIQLKGWSPGLLLNYPIKLGKDNTMYYYAAPVLFSNYVNLHLGIRPIFLSIKEATGLMFEVGLSYQMSIHKVTSYKLKDDYFKN